MKNILPLAFSLLFTLNCFGQSGVVFDNLSLDSDILKMERKYAVYLPAGYESSDRSYPVLYLLHGGGDDQTGWIQFGEVRNIADKAINNGNATAMIIIMPDADTGQRGYFNSPDNTWLYEDFFFEELMPYVENKYRIKKEKRYRAVAGLSMGGGGSFYYAMHHPELFSSSCPLSASVRNYTLESSKERFNRFGNSYSEAQITAYLKKHSSLQVIGNMKVEDMKSVKWYFSIGDDDFLYEGNSLVHIALRKKEVPHEFRINNGSHSWKYWRMELPNVLRFVTDTFHQN
ncbi:MAG: enterochelin esterase-like enzyme [Algoriphagus sp.]|jgi:enterochelin esterase-like enzyme